MVNWSKPRTLPAPLANKSTRMETPDKHAKVQAQPQPGGTVAEFAIQEGRNGPAHRSPSLGDLAPASAAAPSPRAEPARLEVGRRYQIVPGRLSFTVHSSVEMAQTVIDEHSGQKVFFFSGNHQETYEPFCADFGPVNLAVVHHFCNYARKFYTHPSLEGWELVYYCLEGQSRASETNTAFLLAAFMVIELGYSPEDAWAPFEKIPSDAFVPFRDATYTESDYDLTVLACLKGLKKAMDAGWYDRSSFNADEYSYLDDPTIADMHVVSSRIVAFKGPTSEQESVMLDNGVQCFCSFNPAHYTEVFRDKGVSAVVRLNRPDTYNPRGFTSQGFRHYELYFDDCTAPSERLVQQFLDIMEAEDGKVAVHCDAGLGRTGTLAAIHFMKHYDFTAEECIGWLRIVRPGSVLGTQQRWLHWAEANIIAPPCGHGAVKSTLVAPHYEGADHAPREQTLEEAEALGRAVLNAKNQRLLRLAKDGMSGAPALEVPARSSTASRAPAPREEAAASAVVEEAAARRPWTAPRAPMAAVVEEEEVVVARTPSASRTGGRPPKPAATKPRRERMLRSLSEGALTLLLVAKYR